MTKFSTRETVKTDCSSILLVTSAGEHRLLELRYCFDNFGTMDGSEGGNWLKLTLVADLNRLLTLRSCIGHLTDQQQADPNKVLTDEATISKRFRYKFI